ncbi:Retrotransposon-like protein 1 [Anabarilius grahami]|uniref:Retrotransposon-like protein 1 n=1 Tax=Anabarilius grahami TaxID=495550 RepID=A0A3N0XQJ5_ANAGA|nr:Retrotransposon-like protein 1 [Anabarilius grahami]
MLTSRTPSILTVSTPACSLSPPVIPSQRPDQHLGRQHEFTGSISGACVLRRALTSNQPASSPVITSVNTAVTPSPPVYTPWPNQRPSLAKRRIATVFSCSVRWSWRCNHTCTLMTTLRKYSVDLPEIHLLATYRQGLDPRVRLHLAAYEDSIRLERFIQLSTRFATCMQSCLEEHQGQSLFTPSLRRPESISPPEPVNEPMQLENNRLTIEVLTAVDVSILVTALLDSGSAGNFISGTLCRQLKLKTTTSPSIYQIHTITGKPLSRKQVHLCAGPVKLQVGILHIEHQHPLVLEDSTADVILGRPWLEQHNPVVSWRTGEILKWGDNCFPKCFPLLPPHYSPRPAMLPICTTSIESLQYINRSQRTPLIHSSHTSLGTGHPGANETLSLLKERFWWPNMARDVRRYMQKTQSQIHWSLHHLEADQPDHLSA